jgi:lipopolysaccharide export system protein LptA
MPRCCVKSGRIVGATFAMALLLCGMPLSRPGAQAIAPGESEPLQIQADSGIEWQQDAHLYIARGNAVASRGTGEVHADTLIAHYRDVKGGKTGGNTEIYRVEAQGHVTLKRGSQTVVGDRAVDDVDRAITVVTGKALKLTTTKDVVTARDSLEWYDQKQIAVARGDAVATHNGKTIKADILTAYMAKSQPPEAKAGTPGARAGPARGRPTVSPAAGAPGGKTASAVAADSKISRVDAQGHVVITNALDTGRGDFGVYNADTGIATLIGNVVIGRGKDVIRGHRGVMDLNRNISRMMPGNGPGMPHQRVQGLFVRRDRDGKGPASSAATAPGRDPAAAGDKRP